MTDATPLKPQFCTGTGQFETHEPTLADGRVNPSPKAGTPYEGITAADIVGMVQNPPSVPKEQGRWFLPSTYRDADARSHARQYDAGQFHWLAVDVDKGFPPLDAVGAAVVVVLGDVSRLIYATRSATAAAPKWRVLVPLARPLSGAAYADTQSALFNMLGALGIECDPALSRPGQLVYLPNAGGWYQHEVHQSARLDLTPAHPLAQRVAADRKARDEAERKALARRAQRIADRKERGADGPSPVDWFNAKSDLASLLERYGWTPSRNGRDFRSPFQTSKTYATRIMGEGPAEMWVSLSGSDAGQGLGFTTKSGATGGDAFDLLTFFDHGGDMGAALKEIGDEMRAEAGPGDFGSEWTDLNTAGAQETAAGAQEGCAGAQDAPPGGPESSDTEGHSSGPAAWPAPDLRLLTAEAEPPPRLDLSEILTPKAAEWVAAAAEGAGAPADYVALSLLCVTGATVGNARWVTVWPGWSEPPVIWGMCIGNPSAGKSPAIDTVLAPLRRAERPLREAMQAEVEAWEKRAKLAKLAQAVWEKKAAAAMEKGNAPPPVPPEADAGCAPHIPRLVVSDATVERVGVIVEAQPKGVLQFRDELAGWLLAMEARNGGSDRAFWLEAFGGRGFTVERMGRQPLTVDRLLIGALGGIQPDRLSELLLKAKDDGLLARFLPVWPERLQPKRPQRMASDAVADTAMARLTALELVPDDNGDLRPWFVQFDADARAVMDEWRATCGAWEAQADGLLLSFIGKLPGMAARIALVLAAIAYAFDGAEEPRSITPAEFGRACHFLAEYALPMARRAYGAASTPKEERAARVLLSAIVAKRWTTFDTRQAMRDVSRPLLGAVEKLNPAIRALEEADIIRVAQPVAGPRGGRPVRAYEVNPAIWEAVHEPLA